MIAHSALIEKAPYTIIEIVRRSLSGIDERLMEHGERVAYIASELLRGTPLEEAYDHKRLFLLCLLHDVRAYKTEEISDMLQFEKQNVQGHAAYGYLFLQHALELGPYAEAVLYHHTDYRALRQTGVAPEIARYASLIHFADRIDVLLHTGEAASIPALRGMAGTKFMPELVEQFFEAGRAGGIISRIRSGVYRAYAGQALRTYPISGSEAEQHLRMLVYAIDFRSPLTVTHTADTTAISLALGRRLGLGYEALEALRYGAFLHDAGKIAIPVEILEKPDRLTEDEMDIMRSHVVKTGEIIRGFVPEDVYNIACRHHEKLDASGYPLGLSGKDLTLSERIVAVADVASALMGRRSYKEPLEKEQVLSIISGMCEKGQLDCACCDVLKDDYAAILLEVAHDRAPIVKVYETMMREYGALLSRMQPMA